MSAGAATATTTPFAISREGSSFDEFHARHRDKDGKRLGWMPDFYRAKEGVMYHDEAPLTWRICELGKCKSWGNRNREYFSDESGHPLTQKQIGNILGVSDKRVSEAVEELVRIGVIVKEGQILLLTDDPAARRAEMAEEERRKGKKPLDGGRIPAEEKAKFFKAWSAHDPEQFQQYQSLGKEIQERFERQRQMQESAWAWYRQAQEQESGTGRNSEDQNPERGGENVRDGVDDSSGTERTDGTRILNGFTFYTQQLASSNSDGLETLLLALTEHLQQIEIDDRHRGNFANLSGARARACKVAAGHLARVAPERRLRVFELYVADLSALAVRRENKPKNWGIVAIAMEDSIKASQRRPKTRPADAPPPEPAAPPPPQWPAELSAEERPEDAWTRIKPELEKKLGSAPYQNWIKQTRHGGVADGKLTVFVPDDPTEMWIRQNYLPAIRAVIEQLELLEISEVQLVVPGGQASCR